MRANRFLLAGLLPALLLAGAASAQDVPLDVEIGYRFTDIKGNEEMFKSQLDEGVREGWITADERRQLEELREITLDTITVDDFDPHELRSAGYYDLPQHRRQSREAA